jgi:hypothetical protein
LHRCSGVLSAFESLFRYLRGLAYLKCNFANRGRQLLGRGRDGLDVG